MLAKVNFFRVFGFLGVLFFLSSTVALAQPGVDSSKKVYFGGSFGGQIGNETALEISPLIGYRVTPSFSIGFGASYIYYSYTDPNYSFLNYQTSIYGGRVFAKEYVFRNVFAYAELEVLNLEEQNPLTGELRRITTSNPLIGGGFSQPIGVNSFMHFMILWDSNGDVASPYTNPIFRVGFTF